MSTPFSARFQSPADGLVPAHSAGPVVACADCGDDAHATGAQATTIRHTPGGTRVDLPICDRCAALPPDAVTRWRAVLHLRHPEWIEGFPWAVLPLVTADRPVDVTRRGACSPARPVPAVPPPYITDPLDGPYPPAQPWGHIPDSQLAALRLACEHAAWPTTPPTPAGQPYTRPAIEDWPAPCACWRCGVAVEPGNGTVVEAPSPTERWQRQDRREYGRLRRPGAEIAHREQVRADAPKVPGAAWRQCSACTRGGAEEQAERIVTAATSVARPDVAGAARTGALTVMPWPVYAASQGCTGQTDPGATTPYGWFDAAWWVTELARQVQQRRPVQPRPHPRGLGCQVCGVATATSWELLNSLPVCGSCTAAFAPPPPVERDTAGNPVQTDPYATRPSDGRPVRQPRGHWDFTWDTAPPPGAAQWQAMSGDDQRAWDAEHVMCERDLIAAAAAGRPDLVHPGLAAAVSFYLAYEHPDYRAHGGWAEPWAYLADHPTNTVEMLRGAVAEVLHPTPGPVPVEDTPSPVPRSQLAGRPTVASARDLRAARDADAARRRAAREDAALIRATGGHHG